MAGNSDKEGLFNWVNTKLSAILDFPVPQDLTQYILSIENARDLEDYLKTLLNFSNAQHRQFYMELLQKRQVGVSGLAQDVQGYKKSEMEEIYIPPTQTEKKKKSKGQPEDVAPKENVKEFQGKKKSKFVNIYSSDGQARDVILLKGRHRCDCQASKHKLVNNCLKCGRIVCEQEGSGPCLFCDNLVCSREEQQLLVSGSKQAEQLYQKLVDQKKPEGLESAIQQRNRLLEYDRTRQRRTKVIDDESDYFRSNSVWLSKAEREKLQQKEEELRAKRHSSRLDRKITLDFAGRQVLEDDESEIFYDAEDSVLKEISESIREDRGQIRNSSNVHPGIMHPQPVFQDSIGKFQQSASNRSIGEGENNMMLHRRVQDRELIEMIDEGCCLSMHQPWASLLVSGIKVHEGRTWYTSHRGRLWIAAASKVPTAQEIRETEHIYEVLKGGERLRFPSQYPTSCLLGCVNVIDCLPQEEYRINFPEGESDSPFVFVCEDAQELPIRFPIQGKHKIYKLDPKIHAAAQKSLQRMAKLQAERALL
ncbi:activating signal cointegrator 1 [Periplaneta americana]|uniref:activating signal cointegrator 1 n=1 Tax=Periplaneta americana TaxID=6978 RepID=UPI0037E83C5F